MRTLITGATGFLGSHLTELLVGEGGAVAVLVRPRSEIWRIKDFLPRITRIGGDLARIAECRAEIARFAPEVVFHLGWSGVGNAYRNDPRQLDDNIRGTVALARLAIELGCQAFVGLGSQAEYGPHERAVDESVSTTPTTLYGAAKLSAYHLCRVLLTGSAVRFAWLRLFSCYGPKDNPEWLIPDLIRTLALGKRPALTAGEQLWDYVYVADAARAIQCVGRCPHAAGVFNLGSGRSRPLRSVIELIRDMVDPSLPLGFGEVAYRPDQVMHLEADVSKLYRVVGWSPETDLTEGLARTVGWFATTYPLLREAA